MMKSTSILVERFPTPIIESEQELIRQGHEARYLISLIKQVKKIHDGRQQKKICIELANTNLDNFPWKQSVIELIAHGATAPPESIFSEFATSETCSISEARRSIIPFFKWINSRHDKKLMDENRLVRDNILLICRLAVLSAEDVSVRTSNRRTYEKPVIFLT